MKGNCELPVLREPEREGGGRVFFARTRDADYRVPGDRIKGTANAPEPLPTQQRGNSGGGARGTAMPPVTTTPPVGAPAGSPVPPSLISSWVKGADARDAGGRLDITMNNRFAEQGEFMSRHGPGRPGAGKTAAGGAVGLAVPPFRDPRIPPASISYLAAGLAAAGMRFSAFDLNREAFYTADSPGEPLPLEWHRDDRMLALASTLLFGAGAPDPCRSLAGSLGERVCRAVASAFRSTAERICEECFLLGVTVDATGMLGAAHLTRTVKEMRPELPVVWGGPSVVPGAIEGLLKAFPYVDALLWGDGDESIAEIAYGVSSGSGLEGVEGIAFRRGDRIVTPRGRSTVRDLFGLPDPDYSWVDASGYRSLQVPLLLNRGCSWGKCAFCSESLVQPGFRGGDPARAARVYRHVSRELRPVFVAFADDLVNASPAGLSRLCEMLAEAGGAPWTAAVRAPGFTRQHAEAMAGSGCGRAFLGAESFCERTLQRMDKGCTVEQNVGCISACRDAGLAASYNLILEFPGETPEDLGETLKVLKSGRVTGRGIEVTTSMFVPTMGSPVWRDPESYGALLHEKGPMHRFLPDRAGREIVPWDPYWESKSDTPRYRPVRARVLEAIAGLSSD